jgi:hypothetical protein
MELISLLSPVSAATSLAAARVTGYLEPILGARPTVMYNVKYSTFVEPIHGVGTEGQFDIAWCRAVPDREQNPFSQGTTFPIVVANVRNPRRNDEALRLDRAIEKRLTDLHITYIVVDDPLTWEPPVNLRSDAELWRTAYEQQRLSPSAVRYPINRWHSRVLESSLAAASARGLTVITECAMRAFINFDALDLETIARDAADRSPGTKAVDKIIDYLKLEANVDCLLCTAPPYALPLVVIESDGIYHDDPQSVVNDAAKDAVLAAAGLGLVRVRLRQSDDKRATVADAAVGRAAADFAIQLLHSESYSRAVGRFRSDLVAVVAESRPLEARELGSLLVLAESLQMSLRAEIADLQRQIVSESAHWQFESAEPETAPSSNEVFEDERARKWFMDLDKEVLRDDASAITKLLDAAGLAVGPLEMAKDAISDRMWVAIHPEGALDPPPFETRLDSLASAPNCIGEKFRGHVKTLLSESALQWCERNRPAIVAYGKRTIEGRYERR